MRDIDALPVPDFDFSAIRRRAERPRKPPMRRRILAIGILTLMLPALAVAALKFVPFEVTHKYGMWQVYSPRHTSEYYRNPTHATLARVAARARYRVVWPAGIPTRSRMEFLGSDASQMFILAYECPGTLSGYSSAVIIPKDSSGINPNLGKWFDSQTIPHGRLLKWVVGEERMLFESTCLSESQIAEIRSATLAAGSLRR